MEISLAKRTAAERRGALSAGLKEAQKEKASAKATVSLDDLSDDDDETNQLCAACLSGRVPVVRKALKATCTDVNAVGSQGTTPLFIASQGGHSEIVSILLAAQADPSQACFGGATPLYMASSRNHAEVVRLLVRAGAPVDALANGYYTPLLAAVSHGCDEAARTLLAEGADVHVRSDKWGTYVHAAAKSGKVDMLKMLIAFDADLEALFDGLTAQALAELRGHAEAATLLRKAIERRAQRVAAQVRARDAAHAVCDDSTPEALAAAYAEAVERRDAERSSNALNAAAASEQDGAPALTPEEAEAARLAAEKKAQKRARQKARKQEEAAEAALTAEAAAAAAAASTAAAASATPCYNSSLCDAAVMSASPSLKSPLQHARAAEGEYTTRASPPMSVDDMRRADVRLAERTLAELSMGAARRLAHSVAVEEVASGLHKEEVQNQLRMLAGGAARREAAAHAVEEVVAAAQKDEKRSKLRALVGAAMRRDATTQALAIRARVEEGEDAEAAEETPSVAPAEDAEPQRANGCVDVS